MLRWARLLASWCVPTLRSSSSCRGWTGSSGATVRRRIPYIQQLEISDCGAACLAMTLAYHGRDVSPEEIRRATRTSRDGVDAISIIEAARSYGLDARGVSLDLDGLEFLERGSLLHWERSEERRVGKECRSRWW